MTLTIEEAKQFSDKLINEVYPELAQYLSEDSYTIVAHQLRCSHHELRRHFVRPSHLGAMKRIVSGGTL